MSATGNPASTRYELCDPVSPRKWGLKMITAIVLGVATQTDPGYYPGARWRIRDKETGDYVFEMTTSPGGLDSQEAKRSIEDDLRRLSLEAFEREYGIDRRRDSGLV
jgi:hypothetical protein